MIEKNIKELQTPLGVVTVEADGKTIPFALTKLAPVDYICPDVTGRYRIDVDFIPDGRKHYLSCVLHPNQPILDDLESGENLECGGYYSKDEKIKVSIGLYGDGGYYRENGKEQRNDSFDYDAEITQRGGVFQNEYITLPFTKTTHYVFGVCWIMDCNREREAQTWYGADPWIMMDKSLTETTYVKLLSKNVTVETADGRCFSGVVSGYGSSIDGKEEFGVEEPFIEIQNGNSVTVLFKHEIRQLVAAPSDGSDS